MTVPEFVPYCGNPPVPGNLHWNLDPPLILFFLAVAAIYIVGLRDPHAPGRREQLLFGSGLIIAAAALLSPLCNLSVALFSARVTQHMVLTLIAAPMLILGRVELVVPGLVRRLQRLRSPLSNDVALWFGGVAYAVALWSWHLPGPYDATLQNNAVYWAMHITTIGAALVLWKGLLGSGRASIGTAMLVGFCTAMQMSLLGAVLTLANRSLFIVHQGTTWPWGLSPLDDQQLGGLVMWVPAGLLFTIYALVAFGLWLHRYGSEDRASPMHNVNTP